jgi:hypothetical protein
MSEADLELLAGAGVSLSARKRGRLPVAPAG